MRDRINQYILVEIFGMPAESVIDSRGFGL
jgi:hypothetical protein